MRIPPGLSHACAIAGLALAAGLGAAPEARSQSLIEGAVRQVPQAIFDQLTEGGRLAVTVSGASGAMGVAQIFIKDGGVTSGRPLFDAGTPPLPGFAPPPRFTF